MNQNNKKVLVLHNEAWANIKNDLLKYFPRINVEAHTRIDNFLDSAKANPTDVMATVVEMSHDYRDLSGVKYRIGHAGRFDIFPLLKQFGIKNSIAHFDDEPKRLSESMASLEQRLKEKGAVALLSYKWSDQQKKEIYSRYIG